MKKQLLILIMLGLVACETPPVRRLELIAEHPEWDAQMVTIIKEGYLVKGMTSNQVKAAWGWPCWTCTGTVKDHNWDKWIAREYQTQIVFFDDNEKVIRWTQK